MPGPEKWVKINLRFRGGPLISKLRIPTIAAASRDRIKPTPAALKKGPAKARHAKALRIGAVALLGAVLLLGALFFSLRNVILRSVLDSRIRSYQASHTGDVLRIGKARFHGLAGIDLEDIQLRAATRDFSIAVMECSVQVRVIKLITGRVRLHRLALRGLDLDLRREDAPGPLPAGSVGTSGPASPTAAAGSGPDYGARVARLLDAYFTHIPDSLVIESLTLHSGFGPVRQTLQIPRLDIIGSAFETKIEILDGEEEWTYLLEGSIDREKRQLDLRLLPRHSGGRAALPFIERQWGLKVDFDSLSIGLHSRGRKDGVLRLDGLLAVDGLALNHPSIAAADVNVRNASVDYTLRIGDDFFELDKATRVTFNKLAFQPYLKLQTRPSTQLTLQLDKTEFKAADFFDSLPAGLCTQLAGIQAGGDLAYHFHLAIDFSRPEALQLESGLEKRDFSIKRFGQSDFRAVNAPFLHTVFEENRAVASFIVGPENPDFRGLEEIPLFLRNAVLISEDSAFFGHRGFLLDPVKDSIVANLKEGRFVRGASTISMQLAKNLYLKRQKTIARKFEEMIITWLIEENRLLSKERMFEIYLNIIEWGPQVYGARAAARFYFDKDVSDLTLAEAVFMASIIPQPKRFMVVFDAEQRLRPWMQAYYADVSAKMLSRGWIEQRDFDALVADVRLRGPARLLLKGGDDRADGLD